MRLRKNRVLYTYSVRRTYQTYIYTDAGAESDSLVWGSLRLAPITTIGVWYLHQSLGMQEMKQYNILKTVKNKP